MASLYQCSLPCFKTEQMNGFHASALEEEDSKAMGELCNVWVGGWGGCPELYHRYRS